MVASIPTVRHASVVVPLVRGGRWDYADDGLLDRTHLRFFTKATMAELFVDAGYDVEHQVVVNITPMGGLLHLLRLIGRRREEFLAEQYVVVARPA